MGFCVLYLWWGDFMKKYCVDVMKRDGRGRLRLCGREYFDESDRDELRFARRHGLEAAVKKFGWQEEFDDGQYLLTLFREKRKRNGAIKSKKKLDGYEFAVG